MNTRKSRCFAFYFHRLGNAGGGAERMITRLVNALTGHGFEIYLITWDESEVQPYYSIDSSVTWIKLGFSSGISDKIRRTHALANILKENNINTLIGFVMSGDKTVYTAARLAGVRLVAAERNAPSMYYLRYNILQRWTSFLLLYLFCKRIVVQFPEYISSYPACLRNRIVSIANPVHEADEPANPDISDNDGTFILLAVGRLDKVQKRFDCLIRAFKLLESKFPFWNLLIVGDGPEKETLTRLISELQLDSRINIRETTRNINIEYQKANLFVIPSKWEGFPNVLAEAMSHGLPAVGFAGADGVNLLIKDDSGWLAEGVDDEIALSEKLAEAMENDGERLRRGENAIMQMKKYNPESQDRQWVTFLNSLIDS